MVVQALGGALLLSPALLPLPEVLRRLPGAGVHHAEAGDVGRLPSRGRKGNGGRQVGVLKIQRGEDDGRVLIQQVHGGHAGKDPSDAVRRTVDDEVLRARVVQLLEEEPEKFQDC